MNKLERIAVKATRWIGSVQSLIIHTIIFISFFALRLFGVELNTILLILTTILSLEAIYLAIFIQMSVNRNTAQLTQVEHDVEEIQENIEQIEENVGDIADDVENIEKDIHDIQEEVESIEEDINLKKITK